MGDGLRGGSALVTMALVHPEPWKCSWLCFFVGWRAMEPSTMAPSVYPHGQLRELFEARTLYLLVSPELSHTCHEHSLHMRQVYGKVKGLQPLPHSGGRGAAGEVARDRDCMDLQSTQSGCLHKAACSSWKLYLLNSKHMLPNHEHVLVIYNLVRKLSGSHQQHSGLFTQKQRLGRQPAAPCCVSYATHSTLLPGAEHYQLPVPQEGGG